MNWRWNSFMKFIIKERASESPLIEKIWRTQADYCGTLISPAEINSEIVVITHKGKTSLIVRGPATKAITMNFLWTGAEIFAIVFKPGTFMPDLPPKNLKDHNNVELPEANNDCFWLDDSVWEFPTYQNADTFISRLVQESLLVHDPIVDAIRQGHPQSLSIRSLQYRFLQATGMSHQTVRQIERAHLAATCLAEGKTILDAVGEAGYFDQPHLTRSLKHFLGQTPAQIDCESFR
jgi:AraC-like DNA-binding protein